MLLQKNEIPERYFQLQPWELRLRRYFIYRKIRNVLLKLYFQYPNLSVGVFYTTYTYLNTILDDDQPLVATSKHTVTNTITAPDDYLSMLLPLEQVPAIKDTNTYYSTIPLEKTLFEGDHSKVISTKQVVTQVVITESVPPKATSVMTSYIALDNENSPIANYSTTDVVKTYFVTYTYYNTILDKGSTVTETKISTSEDIVTEKLFINPKKTTKTPDDKSKQQKIDLSNEKFDIFATKTYHTTFTYFTTLLQDDNTIQPTIISSHSKIIENVVTESVDRSLLDQKYIDSIKTELKESPTLTKMATLNNGESLEITVIANIAPTKVLPIEKTKIPESIDKIDVGFEVIESSTAPSVITGSTIIFLDEESSTETPKLTNVKSKSKVVSSTTKLRRGSAGNKSKTQVHHPTKAIDKKSTKIAKPANQVPDLLGLGSININSLQALTPVLNAMAGLIKTNLKSTRNSTTTQKPLKLGTKLHPIEEYPDTQNRSPIYIPVGIDDFEVAESQNVANFHYQDTVEDWKKPIRESPLLNGGIPISPGDVITANSDVIVGKPGRIGPRIPSIPLNQIKDDGYGMKPPPLAKPKRKNNEIKHIPIKVEKPVIHAPSKDDYVGPPPPLRVEKHKHIPLTEPIYAQQNQYGINKHSEEEVYVSQNTYHILDLPVNPINNVNPSIVLPEIIERSTGQPLLVNIQPSQVAFVNIPHNRSTALIYGGSTEHHRNGEYFDDPSPYPQPEFSGIDFENTKFVYQHQTNQKQVGGVIKVAPQPIRNSEQIEPSRPHQVNINVPAISFGMIQKDNDFNAHMINHPVQFSPPALSYDINYKDSTDLKPPDEYQKIFLDQTTNPTENQKKQFKIKPSRHSVEEIIDLKPPADLYKTRPPPKRNYIINHQRPKSEVEISQFMAPPPLTPNHKTSYRLKPIPLTPETDIKQPQYDKEDLSEEDGLIQESNQRPLLPGQLPDEIYEILKTTTEKPRNNQTLTTKPSVHQTEHEINKRPRPVVSNPRPFATVPLVRPENQQTNQINHFDQSTASSFITFLDSGTPRPTTKPKIPPNGLRTTVRSRPKITSLPIDHTEKPFKTSKPLSILDMLKNERVTTSRSKVAIKPVLEIEMRPPKIVSNQKDNDLEVLSSSRLPFPAETIEPPPSSSIEVVGMNPPPPVTTYKPSTTTRIIPEVTRNTRTRRPLIRRPTLRTTKRPNYEIFRRNRTSTTTESTIITNRTTESTSITPTPPILTKLLSMDVIIGNPSPIDTTSEKVQPEISSQPTLESTIESTTPVKSNTRINSLNKNTYHTGNEVKIVDETSTRRKKPVVPTRYITHTQTSTVTITKTTVVKTLGGPLSTLTLLVTKTEKSTLVDTVTTIHTLVKPTSIIETITTTISNSLYPQDVQFSTYPSIHPTSTTQIIPTITVVESNYNEDLKEFIINETEPPLPIRQNKDENESIFVVMTDKKQGSVIKVPNESYERDEIIANNEVNNVLLGGIFIPSPSHDEPPQIEKCAPECKASRNELCQKIEGLMRCICRPGFARMFPDRPCIRKL